MASASSSLHILIMLASVRPFFLSEHFVIICAIILMTPTFGSLHVFIVFTSVWPCSTWPNCTLLSQHISLELSVDDCIIVSSIIKMTPAVSENVMFVVGATIWPLTFNSKRCLVINNRFSNFFLNTDFMAKDFIIVCSIINMSERPSFLPVSAWSKIFNINSLGLSLIKFSIKLFNIFNKPLIKSDC